jgi:hypothetical protein
VEPPPPPAAPPPEKPAGPQHPLIIFGSVPSKDKPEEEFESSSSLSDVVVDEPRPGPVQNADPFPLDENLQRRVVQLLDEAIATPDPAELQKPATFHRPTLKPKPPKPKPMVEPPSEEPPVPHRPTATAAPAAKNSVPEWRPKVTSIRESRVIGVQEISIDEFSQEGSQPRKTTQLKEIQPTGTLPARKRPV